MARWPVEPCLPAMTDDDLRAIAHCIVEAMVKDHPAEAAVIASLVTGNQTL
jgi:hypothetical protein